MNVERMKLSAKTLAMDVLIVDDEPISRQMAAQTLESAGYCVHQASNGREACELLLTSSIELVVCDWSMPEMDGLELCRHLRSGTVDRYIYMILLPGNGRPEDIVKGLEAGADEFLVKPFNPIELILRVNIGRRIIEQEVAFQWVSSILCSQLC